ncbi:SPATA4, partial [Symbiodinium pilosum]
SSKMVLQIGLSALAKVLRPYPSLLPAYVSVLLKHPANFRSRLLERHSQAMYGTAPSRRKRYVMGTSCRVYEECCISEHWPAVEVARTLAEQCAAESLPHFEPEHLEVLTSCLPPPEVDIDNDWLAVFEKVKNYVFVAALDPVLHMGAVDVIRRFWLCRPQSIAL